MNEKLLRLMHQAKESKVIDSGSVLIFNDFLKECQNRIIKSKEQIQRLLGQIDQLTMMDALVTDVVAKYVALQREADESQAEKDDMLNPPPDLHVQEKRPEAQGVAPSDHPQGSELKEKPNRKRKSS